MSQGKYSPAYPHGFTTSDETFQYNCFGKIPAPWNHEVYASGITFDEQTMFGNYDNEGYDRYGYSAFDNDGIYCGVGSGVDRNKMKETDYLCMDAEEFEQYL